MKKRGKGFRFSNRFIYTLVAILILVLAGVGVYAYGGNSPQTIGHSMGELMPPYQCNGYLKYDPSNGWACGTPSSSIPATYARNVEIVTDEFSVPVFASYPGEFVSRVVDCPSGKKVIGGGCRLTVGNPNSFENNQYYVNAVNFPSSDHQWNCAYVGISSSGTVSFTKKLYTSAICANY